MNKVQCAIKGCTEVFQTTEPVSSQARFICKNHPRAHQLAAVGRIHNPKKDDKDQDIHFQNTQFDPALYRGASPTVDQEMDDRSDEDVEDRR